MRYVIETTEEGNNERVWNTINSLVENKLINLIEKGDPIENMKEDLRRVARSMEVLEKLGIDHDLIVAWIKRKTNLSIGNIETCLSAERNFFKKLGIELK